MEEKVLAIAAGHEITEGELNRLISNYPPEQQIYMSSPQARQEALEQLIAFHLFHRMAIEEKITESQEYADMVEKIKVELASHMAATSVVEGIQVSEEEERAYYEANLSQFEEGAQVRARHILVDSKEQAEQVLDQLGIPMSSAVGMFLRQVVLHQGIPFEIKLQKKAPPAYDSLTKDQFDAEIGKGMEDVREGRVYSADAVEEEMRRDYGI